ncbi:MAG: hypothetical protein K9K88_06685 [Desulfobacterales bacterium]|nr:hypothetical protein [Desulfobacterales bacterium]
MSTTVSDTPRIRYVAHLLAEPYEHIKNQWLVRAVGEKGFKAQGAQLQFDKDEDDGQPKGIDGLQISKYADSETGTDLSKSDIREFRETLLKLLDESIIAEKNNYNEKVEEIWQEIYRVIEIIKTYNAETVISKNEKTGNYNISIKTRHHDKNFERARTNVRNNITNALKTISEHLPALEKHLVQSIKTTSTNAVYDPQRDHTNKSIKWYVSF